jgi:membrane-bound lytic murein transglycosylase D
MRRWLPIGLVLVGCSGHSRVPVVTTATPVAAAPVAPPPPPADPVQRPPRAAPPASFDVVVARDSAADAAVLDSLTSNQPAATLPDLPIGAHPTWDLNVADFSNQPRVQYYLDYFTGRAHDRFQIWLDRMARYEGYARAQFAAHDLPGDFVYLGLIESGFSSAAVSRTYAVGMWQFMLGTGKLYGLRTDAWVDERRDPIKATDAAAHLLQDLTARFGSHYLAAAAYNAGAGRVQRGLGQLHTDPAADDSTEGTGDEQFFSLADTRMIRDETKNYVPQLIAAAIIAKQPDKYGFQVTAHPIPFSHDSVMVDGGTGLDLIARLADTSLDALRDLNPHLLRLVTPPTERYAIRVPIGAAARIAAEYNALPDSARHAIEAHQVRAGETVAALARRFGSSSDAIREANRTARGRSLAPGTMLYIPVSSAIPTALLREPDPPRTVRFVTRTVVVRKGESMSSLARRAGVSASVLRSDNPSLGTVPRAGQRLTVHRAVVVSAGSVTSSRARATVVAPAAHHTAVRPSAPVSGPRTHVVRNGESVSSIAAKFGIRASVLISINHLPGNGKVKAGQTLKIPG